MRRHLSQGLALLFLLAGAPVAHAQEDGADTETSAEEAFQGHVENAMRHYRDRRYTDAVASFQAAFDLRPEPELMYNIARSHERALHRQAAIDAYGRFLELPGTTSEMRSRAISARNSLRQELAAMEAAEQAPSSGTGEEAAPATNEASTERGVPHSRSSRSVASKRRARIEPWPAPARIERVTQWRVPN